MVWEECAAVGMPRAIVVTHLEAARADFEEMTRVCAEAFGAEDPDAVLPLYLPLRGPAGPDGHAPVTGLVGLLTRKVFDYTGGRCTESEPDAEQLPRMDEARNRLIEGIISESEDETLMDRYLGGEQVDVETLIKDLERAVARAAFFPVLPAAPAAEGAAQGLGTVRRASRSPAPRTGRWSPRSSRPPPTRTSAGSPWCGSSPVPCVRTRRCTSPATA
jgi:elongation factor G